MTGIQAAEDEKETSRLEAFSDGVFAIAITLLVLELKVPHAEGDAALAAKLAAAWPSYAAFLSSFGTIGIMWINHHTLFRMLRRCDHGLLVWNGLLLLGVTVVPFPTALFAHYLGHPGERVAALVYSGTFLVVAIVFNGLWAHIRSTKRPRPLLRGAHDSPEVLEITSRYRFGPIFYGAAFLAAFLDARLTVAITTGLALFFALPQRAKSPDPSTPRTGS